MVIFFFRVDKVQMLVLVLLMDALGYRYLPRGSFWKRHSTKLLNSVPTITSPNFFTILSGVHPQVHGVLNNEVVGKPGFVLSHSTLFDDFPGFKRFYVSNWRPNRKVIHEDQVDFIHTRRVWEEARRIILNHKPNEDVLIVVNTDILDSTAHKYGGTSPQYQRTAHNINKRTRELHAVIQDRPYVLLGLADHGFEAQPNTHGEYDHEDEHDPAVREVPLLVEGNISLPSSRPRLTVGFRRWLKRMF